VKLAGDLVPLRGKNFWKKISVRPGCNGGAVRPCPMLSTWPSNSARGFFSKLSCFDYDASALAVFGLGWLDCFD
jgi:hypothetical protein